MVYTLMHKRVPIADIEIDDATSTISKIMDIHAPEHLPLGVPHKAGQIDRRALNEWWTGRAIPASRSGIRDALELLNVSSAQMLLIKCYGLSLSDQYWVRAQSKRLEWDDVNFFENDFSEDVGNALFGRAPEGAELDLMSPDNTSDGWLKKKWVIADGKRMLVKGGSGPAFQEPLNEVIASAILRRLNVPHVPYSLLMDGETPLSVCEDFITTETELFSAWHILQTEKQPNHLPRYQHYLNCCERLGIPHVQESLDTLLAVDYLIANTDRHLNNFGAVRNADTLEWLGAAPVFDCGTSLWHDQFAHMIHPRAEVASKPFLSKHSRQIELISSWDWLDLTALAGADEECADVLKQSPYIDDARRDALCHALRSRIEMLEDIVLAQNQAQGHGMKPEL